MKRQRLQPQEQETARVIKCNDTTLYSQADKAKKVKLSLECGPMLNVMAALPNTGGAFCSTPQSLADAHY